MDLSYTPEQDQFRDEVRSWIAEAMPAAMKKHAEDRANFENSEITEWHKILFAKVCFEALDEPGDAFGGLFPTPHPIYLHRSAINLCCFFWFTQGSGLFLRLCLFFDVFSGISTLDLLTLRGGCHNHQTQQKNNT